MGIWRIHIKNDVSDGYNREDLLRFCQQEQLIGVGWVEITTRDDSYEAVKKAAGVYTDSTRAIKAINAMRKMEIDDLIWTRLNGVYFLCRVKGLWKDSKPTDMHDKLDVSNYVNVEWLEIGMEDLVPGKVVSSFRPAASAQSVAGVEEISKYIWNKYKKTDYYSLSKNKMDIWSILSAESIEELVILYLQVSKGFHIYSTTMKYATREYECIMVNKEGVHAFPQVKSGSVSLSAADYMEAIKREPTAQVYLFTTSEKYSKNGSKNIFYISKAELEDFIRNNRKMLPDLTDYWIDLCGFYS